MSTASDLQGGVTPGSSRDTVPSDQESEDLSIRAASEDRLPAETAAWFDPGYGPSSNDNAQPPTRVASDDDQALADALKTGNSRKVMEVLVTQHGKHVYCYCRRLLGSSEDSDDVAQTVFVQAFQCLKDLPRIRSPRGWLLRIARNRCLDRLKAVRRLNKRLDYISHNVIDEYAADGVMNKDPRVIKALDQCLDRLDARSRTVLVLRFHDGLSFNEISDLTSDTVAALRVRLARALTALRQCLESKGVQL
jgi:RNA polymerase sigma-70 factor (ECF subfamily)